MPGSNKSFAVVVAALLLGAPLSTALAAKAQPPGPPAGDGETAHGAMQPKSASAPAFNAVDTDGDRRISAREARAVPRLEQHFAAADLDRDGTIDRSEFSKFENEMHGFESQRPTRGRSTEQEKPGFKPSKAPNGGLLPPDAAVRPGTEDGQ